MKDQGSGVPVYIAIVAVLLRLNPSCEVPDGLLLKGSWDLVTRVIIRVTILITPIKVLITLLTKSHDPPSRGWRFTSGSAGRCLVKSRAP